MAWIGAGMIALNTKSMFLKPPRHQIVKPKEDIVEFITQELKKGMTHKMIGSLLTRKYWTFKGAVSVTWSAARTKTFHHRNRKNNDETVLCKREPIRDIHCIDYRECLDKCAKANQSLYCELCEKHGRNGKDYAGISPTKRNTSALDIS